MKNESNPKTTEQIVSENINADYFIWMGTAYTPSKFLEHFKGASIAYPDRDLIVAYLKPQQPLTKAVSITEDEINKMYRKFKDADNYDKFDAINAYYRGLLDLRDELLSRNVISIQRERMIEALNKDTSWKNGMGSTSKIIDILLSNKVVREPEDFKKLREDAINVIKGKPTGKCWHCGAEKGIHHYDTYLCPRNGKEAREGVTQEWQTCSFEDSGMVMTDEEKIDALIESGHLSSHLKEGEQRKPLSFEEWIKLYGDTGFYRDSNNPKAYQGYLTAFKQ